MRAASASNAGRVTLAARLAAGLAASVTVASIVLVALALRSDDYTGSRALAMGWVLVPAVGVAAYLVLRWGLAAALGALAAPTVGAAVDGAERSVLPLLVAAGALGVAVVLGHLSRLAERREHG